MSSLLLVANADADARDLMIAALAEHGLAERLAGCDSGRSLVRDYTAALIAGESVVGVVLETRLPVGGGKSSAIALRAVEKAFGVPPVPFVFYTTAPRDPNLERVMTYLGKSNYYQQSDESPPGPTAAQAVADQLKQAAEP